MNSRNGYRRRDLDTTVGTLPLMVPKLRSGSYFPTDLFERWSRTDRALAAAVAEMYVTGTSTRKVGKVAAKLGVESLSKDQVSRLCAVIDGEVDAFLARDWSGMRFCYLFLDATYVSCRVNGRVRRVRTAGSSDRLSKRGRPQFHATPTTIPRTTDHPDLTMISPVGRARSPRLPRKGKTWSGTGRSSGSRRWG